MRTRKSTIVVFALVLVVVASVAFALGRWSSDDRAVAAQQGPPTWNSTMLWRPTLEEAGLGLAEIVNQIDASCTVDVDPVVTTNGTGPEGTVYAFAVTWVC